MRGIIKTSLEEAVIETDGNTNVAEDLGADRPTVGLFGSVGTDWHGKVIPLLDIPHMTAPANPPAPPVQQEATEEGKTAVNGVAGDHDSTLANPNEPIQVKGTEIGAAIAQTEGGALSGGAPEGEPIASQESQQLDASAAASAPTPAPVAQPDYNMYVLDPVKMGVTDIMQAQQAALGNPSSTVIAFDAGDQLPVEKVEEVNAVKSLLSGTGANVFDSLTASVEFLNRAPRRK